ncbi:MAG: tetratricopeptide repeat protein [Candidatus Cloacimonetes bacterium]|nr:tetratricopeptide repeat protein [Candidatus Cloacimonadota bacterium]
MLKRMIWTVVLSLALCYGLYAKKGETSNQERYAYRYIVLLYEQGELDILESEISGFLARYPTSEYQSNVRFLDGNTKLQLSEFTSALDIYNSLLFEDLDLSVKHQLYLNRAIALYHLKDYSAAMTQLQVLESSSRDPELMAKSNLYKARIYSDLGQYFSAIRAYQYALGKTPDPAVQYEYLQALLNHDKVVEAEEILQRLSQNDQYSALAKTRYAEYLLLNERGMDFENLLQNNPELLEELTIQVLVLKKSLAEEDYARAKDLLQKTSESQEYLNYYRALLAKQEGAVAQADSLFANLVQNAGAEIKVLSYLERLKILYQKEPVAAMLQLGQYIESSTSDIARADQYLTMGYFAYQKQDYLEALKQLHLARAQAKDRDKLAETDIFIAKSWLKAKQSQRAIEAFNRYLNLYAQGRDRDQALFYMGFLYHEAKDYPLAKSAFQQLVNSYPDSDFVPSAKFYLAEMDYYLANYNLSLQAFLDILKLEPDNSDAALRVAQIYYYQENYPESEHWLQKISPSYDSMILQGHVHFNQKDYNSALQLFSLAERATRNPLQETEAQSYRALCLYQLKRYSEATELYLKLFKGSESPDTYLYLGAKSAYAAGDYHQALRLYDQFIDTYPQSTYFLPVLADVANCYYNMGNFEQAVRDYISIISRFRNVRDFSDADRSLLGEVFTGLELSLKRAQNMELIEEIAELSDTFQSLYISFELSYILIRQYAENAMWQDLLDSAEEVRKEFPELKRNEVEMLMAESLIQLNEYSTADSLLGNLYRDTQDMDALVRWAEIDYLSSNYEAAMQKYRQAYAVKPSAELWFNMLKASSASEYVDFNDFWELGLQYQQEIPAARLIRLEYLVATEDYDSALEFTDAVINESLNPHDHATAFMYKGIIQYQQQRFGVAISELRRTLLLFPDYIDIQDKGLYYLIRSYLDLGERSEAEMLLWNMGSKLSDENLSIINKLMEESR